MSDRIRLWKLLSATVFLTAAWTFPALAQSHEDLYFDIVLRDTGSATIHADVFNNPDEKKGEMTVLAVHGMSEVGSMYQPLADAIYADPVLKSRVKRIVSIDLVAHGLSTPPTLPSPLMFGDLLIEDNVSVVIQAVGYLDAIGIGPEMIMGHSMGGLAVQATQEFLLTQDSSLRELGVKKAVLIAAVPARGTVWTRYPGGDLTPFIVYDPQLGMIFDLPVALCGSTGAFTTLAGTTVPGTPSYETCIANEWMGPEPLTAIAELVGSNCDGDPDDPNSDGLCRPYVRQNAFASRQKTVLTVLSFSQDVLTPVVDQDELYTYLTGKSTEGPDTLYIEIDAGDAVHSMYISNPSVVASALRTSFK